ncbi:SDR family oxidoreductase [Paraglaciecola sp.]|uniref:SDR family oxidoreductase n=1 Tax=Paraglaciecola sp. TaxID=1920173 RepID=UPI003EFB10A9
MLNVIKPNKVALITGASRGIGAATALLFAEHGYDICVNYVANDLAAEQIKQQILKLGVNCITVKADVANSSDVERLFSTIDSELGALTVLINNTGILKTQSRLVDMDNERFSQVLNTNVMSCFYCCKQAIKRMSTEYGGFGGNIVNVSSGAAKSGSPNEYIDYAASKGAIDTLTIGLAKEVAGEEIRVNGVRPGMIYTDMHADGGEPARVDRLKTKIPLQRGGSVNEVAEAIYWLASDKSSFSTGTFLDVTGGL